MRKSSFDIDIVTGTVSDLRGVDGAPTTIGFFGSAPVGRFSAGDNDTSYTM
jgi:hypothetical protein